MKTVAKTKKLAEPLRGRHNRMTTADLLSRYLEQRFNNGTRLLNWKKYTGLDLLLQLAPQFLD